MSDKIKSILIECIEDYMSTHDVVNDLMTMFEDEEKKEEVQRLFDQIPQEEENEEDEKDVCRICGQENLEESPLGSIICANCGIIQSNIGALKHHQTRADYAFREDNTHAPKVQLTGLQERIQRQIHTNVDAQLISAWEVVQTDISKVLVVDAKMNDGYVDSIQTRVMKMIRENIDVFKTSFRNINKPMKLAVSLYIWANMLLSHHETLVLGKRPTLKTLRILFPFIKDKQFKDARIKLKGSRLKGIQVDQVRG